MAKSTTTEYQPIIYQRVTTYDNKVIEFYVAPKTTGAHLTIKKNKRLVIECSVHPNIFTFVYYFGRFPCIVFICSFIC